MATVSFRVPDDLKERMDEHPTVNWSAVLREHIAAELEAMESRDLARAVLVSERLSSSVDPADAREADAAGTVREWRERRYGPDGEPNGGPGEERSGGFGEERGGGFGGEPNGGPGEEPDGGPAEEPSGGPSEERDG